MKIRISYGEKGLVVDVPRRNLLKVLEIKDALPIKNLSKAVRNSLNRPINSRPLRELACKKRNAVVVISDHTRPIPYKDILPPLLSALIAAGLRKEDITILIATGIHRPMTKKAIDSLVGKTISNRFRIINHRSCNKRYHIYLGKTRRGTPVYIDRTYVKADLKIVTGLIEPHLLAGYSGGRKGICPGLVANETIRFVHGPKIIDHPKAHVGILKGNPLHEEALAIAKKAGIDFCLNVTINRGKEVTGVFAGDFEKVHIRGVKFLDRFNRILVPERPDIIITTGGGAPLDNTFYQSVKGPNNIRKIIKKGGIVILASSCREGVGSPEFTRLLLKAKDLHHVMAMIRKPGFFCIDQWMVQHLCHVLERADVYLYTHNIKPALAKRLLIKPISSVEDGIKLALDKMGHDAKILVIPSGPYLTPFL